jgi:hypothetical protein
VNKHREKRRAHWAAYLWPGLPHLWISGSWAGLALALGFTVLLNVLILTTLVWPEWLAPRVKLACAISAGLVWIAALVETRNELRRLALERESQDQKPPGQTNETEDLETQAVTGGRADALFSLAQKQYLRAEWSDAERSLRSLLKLDKEDVEANLLLASIHRRVGRTSDARRRLQRLTTREDADRWQFEVLRELDWLESTAEPAKYEEAPPAAA